MARPVVARPSPSAEVVRHGAVRVRGHLRGEAGLTAVEYGLIVALIGLVFVLAGPALGDALAGLRHTVTGGVAS